GGREDRGVARRERGAVLGGVGASRHARGGLHGAHPGRGRVPRRCGRGGGAMTAGTVTPYQPVQPTGRDGFAQLLRAEWTKFRTVRGWVIGMVVAALVTVGLGLLISIGGSNSCQKNPTAPVLSGAACLPRVPLGPGGQAVTDQFYFVRQPLAGQGSI